MNEMRRKLYMFAGLWLSLVALTMGASTFIPLPAQGSERELALLYRFASTDKPQIISVTPQTGKALIADLGSMQITMYENGAVVKSVPILSRGREGTSWETPAGKYAIQVKEQKHFSTIGGTWMPYSMQFYGNFFIHGWPTYTDGRDVPPGYSGGCIRLSTADARELYEFAPRGTKLIVLNAKPRGEFATSSHYYLRGAGTPPAITASAFIVADLDNETTLWSRAEHEPRHPGGLTAFLAGLTALETVNQYKIVRMSELLLGEAVLRRSSIGALDEMPVGTLIYPLLFDTNDTAAKAYAREHGTKQFVKYMNEKSAAVGMDESKWGGALSSDEATTTAADLLRLLRYGEKSKPFLIGVTLAEERTLTDKQGDERFQWENKNPWVLSRDAAFRGGIARKNAEGGGSAMILFDLPVSEFGSRKIAFVVLSSNDLQGDVDKLRAFVVNHFVYGIERGSATFIREAEEPTPSLLKKVQDLLNLRDLLDEKIEYERDV